MRRSKKKKTILWWENLDDSKRSTCRGEVGTEDRRPVPGDAENATQIFRIPPQKHAESIKTADFSRKAKEARENY